MISASVDCENNTVVFVKVTVTALNISCVLEAEIAVTHVKKCRRRSVMPYYSASACTLLCFADSNHLLSALHVACKVHQCTVARVPRRSGGDR